MYLSVSEQAVTEYVVHYHRERNRHAYAERFVLSIRRECLDRFVPLSERHLRTAVTEYVVHYHRERNHQGLGNELLTPLPASANSAGPIVSRERLGTAFSTTTAVHA